MPPPRPPPPPDDSQRGRRKQGRQHLAELFADIPPKRRAQFMRRAQDVLLKIIEDADPEPTKYDDKGRIAIMGTNKRDRAAMVRDALASMKTLGEISRDATEQRIAVTKLIHGVFNQPAQGRAGSSDTALPLESLTTLQATVEHNECPPTPLTPTPPPSSPSPETGQSSSDTVSPTSDDSAD